MSILCSHLNVVRVDGDHGAGICARCGIALDDGVLTEAKLLHGMEAIRRAPHTMQCVQVGPHDYVCSPDCPLRFK